MLIEKELEIFLETALEQIEEPVSQIHVITCHWCAGKIHLPLIAKKHDVERFQQLLEMADKYLKDKGGHERMMKELLQKIMRARKLH